MGKPSDQNPYRVRHPTVTMLYKRTPRKAYFSPRLWPGYATFVVAFVWEIIEFLGTLDFLRTIAGTVGIVPAMIFHLILSPWFGVILMIISAGYVVFVGEPKIGVQRQPWWPIIGWSTFFVCLSAMVVAISLTVGAIENQKALQAEAMIEQQDHKSMVLIKEKFIFPSIPDTFFDCGVFPAPTPWKTQLDVAQYIIQIKTWGEECRLQLLLVKKLLEEDQLIAENASK